VPRSLNRENIQKTFELTYESLKKSFGIARPRIAVAALNPHGGEKGNFGAEEIEIIAPAVRAARKRGIPVHGPFPAEFFCAARLRRGGGHVCDQGLIRLNCTISTAEWRALGHSFAIGGPWHGYDIAGATKPDDGSMSDSPGGSPGAKLLRGR
jgi:4-hydroxythreonine-4-phosphate dehydrogenase